MQAGHWVLRGQFLPGIRFWEINFARALGFWQFLTKKCAIFDKRVEKVTDLQGKIPIQAL